jgi:TRAP-type C4-dicarboxylate transport system substrate-binding protein
LSVLWSDPYWNQREWKSFPKDIQDAILEAAKEAGRFETALSRGGLDGDTSINILKDEFNYTMEVPDPIAFMESKGMEIHMLTDEEREAFAQATHSVYDKWIEEIGPEVYEKAKADIAQ